MKFGSSCPSISFFWASDPNPLSEFYFLASSSCFFSSAFLAFDSAIDAANLASSADFAAASLASLAFLTAPLASLSYSAASPDDAATVLADF